MFHPPMTFRLLMPFAAASIAISLVACAPGPRLITQPSSVPNALGYQSALLLRVADAAASVERTAEIAREQGGHVLGSFVSGDESGITIAVPSHRYENARFAISQMGELLADDTHAEVSGERTYSQISARFTSSSFARRIDNRAIPMPPNDSAWNPLRTFSQAIGVTGAIFSVIVDVLIWLTVVGGPFVLIGFLLKRVFGRH